MFANIGYGSNFGVVIGLIGLCLVATLYLVMCVLLFLGFVDDTDIRDKPTLDLMQYVSVCLSSADNMKKRKGSDVKSINHDNDIDEHHPLSPVMQHKPSSIEDTNRHMRIDTHQFVERLSVTQPVFICVNYIDYSLI